MPSPRYLKNYTDDQANIVLNNCAIPLQRGHLREPKDIYPDIQIPSSVAYTRYTIPLPFLVLLYEKTTVYVPPLSKKDLLLRWGTSIETVIALAQSGIVVPIIGRPTDYRASHFAPLLELKPPSLWARGVALLDRLGMNAALDERDCPLPIAEMAHVKPLRRKYSHYESGLRGEALTTRIKRELLLNYADLCIFGEQQLAESLGRLREPQQIVDRLLLANEIRTYPILFGLGGTANYDTRMLRAESGVARTLPNLTLIDKSKVIPGNLNLLFNGLGIDISHLTTNEIIEFHVSGNGARLRAAMAYFERRASKKLGSSAPITDSEQVIAAAAALEDVILNTARELSSPEFIRRASNTQRTSNVLLKVGSPALGGWLSHLAGASVFDGIGGGAIVQTFIIDPVKDKIVDAALVARFRPGLANLWRIAKARRR